MSSKASIFLTGDNEHFYEECNEPHYEGDKFIGFNLVLEIEKKNIEILCNDEEALVVEFNNPNSEIYKELIKLKKFRV